MLRYKDVADVEKQKQITKNVRWLSLCFLRTPIGAVIVVINCNVTNIESKLFFFEKFENQYKIFSSHEKQD